jgi:hypothetical protein
MVTKTTYKNYSNQIAKLFCKDDLNKVLCEASIINRLNNFLDDYTYPYFLAKLNSGRQYIINLEQFQNKGFRIVLTDLITGERQTAWWDIAYNLPYLSKLPGKLLNHQFNIISANKTFTEADKTDYRITWNPLKANYGITFVPSQVPGYNPPGGGGGGYVPPGGGGGGGIQITPGEVPGVNVPAMSGFDFGELLKNPIVLIGAGLAAYFLLIKK